MRTTKLYLALQLALGSLGALAVSSCQSDSTGDETLYVDGSETAPILLEDGGKACEGKKVLICHIPPGNPDNAHTICVSVHAQDTHVERHGDGVGACETEPTPPPEEPPPPEEEPEPLPECVENGAECQESVSCCEGSVCDEQSHHCIPVAIP